MRKRLPMAVAYAIAHEDKRLLSILGKEGARVSGMHRREDAAWRHFHKERQAAEFEAARIAAHREELRLLGLDRLLPDHENDADYELLPYAA